MGIDCRNRRITYINGSVGPTGRPRRNPVYAQLKKLLKSPDYAGDGIVTQSDLDSLSAQDHADLIQTLRMMPRQLRKKMLTKAGIRIVVE
jgi:hypothetical protein